MTDTPEPARRSPRRKKPDVWMTEEWSGPTARAAGGKEARKRVPRVSHARFEPAADRDPIAILAKQEVDRLQNLLPLRHARMAESAFAYYRGTPAVMAFDLAGTPRSDIFVQASGDAHLSNFGLYASPERRLVFDANDFDETMPGSLGMGCQAPCDQLRHRRPGQRVLVSPGFARSAMEAVRGYREWMARYASMSLLDVWYSVITDADIRALVERMPESSAGPGPNAWPRWMRSSRRLAERMGHARSTR